MIYACLLANVRHSSIVCLNNTCRIVDMRCLNTKIGGIDMSETDEPQGFEHTHNILNINQNSQSLMTFITSKLKSKLKQHIIIARGKKRIDYRLSYNFYTTYYDNVDIKKIDCEYTYAMPNKTHNVTRQCSFLCSATSSCLINQHCRHVYQTTLQ